MRKQRKRQIAGMMAAIFMLSGINTSALAGMTVEMPDRHIEENWQAEVKSPSDAGREIIKRVTSSNSDRGIAEKATPNNAVMFAAAGETLESDVIQITQNGSVKELTLIGGICNGDGYTIEKTDEDTYTLRLADFSGESIRIDKGSWTINFSGTNTLNAPAKKEDPMRGALDIRGEEATAALNGTGMLILNGYRYGLGVFGDSHVQIEAGTIKASATEESYATGIGIGTGAKLEISGGNITGNGGRGIGMYAGTDSTAGELEITAGEVFANGSVTGKGLEVNREGKVTISGGKLTATGGERGRGIHAEGKAQITVKEQGEVEASGGEWGIRLGVSGGTAGPSSLVVEGEKGYVKTNSVEILNFNSVTIQNGGILESTGNINNSGTFNLNENGKLVLDGTYTGGTWGKFNKTGGTIEGSGTFSTGSKIVVNLYSWSNKSAELNTTVPASDFFYMKTAGLESELEPTTYTIESTSDADAGAAEIDENNIIHFTKIGPIQLKAEIAESRYYSGASATATINVKPIALDSRVKVSAYSEVYDGMPHPAVTVTVDGQDPRELGLTVKYAEFDRINGLGEYTEECPMVTDVSDSGRSFNVRLSGSDYQDCTKYAGQVKITYKNVADQDGWSISMDQTDFTYNGSAQSPKITVKVGDAVLEEGTDYIITGYINIVSSEDKYSAIDAGTYAVRIYLKRNFRGYINSSNYHPENESGTFVIHPQILTAKIADYSLAYMKKAYDGTRSGTAEMKRNLRVDFYAGENKLSLNNLWADTDNAIFEFSDENVGKKKRLQISEIQLDGSVAENYKFDGRVETDQAEITPGNLYECELKADPLEYTGEPQTPVVRHTVIGSRFERIDNFDVTYAAKINGTYGKEIPSFTSPGTYKVYYKLSAKNYGTVNKSFPVTVTPANLEDAEIHLKKTNDVYTGESLKTDVEVVYKGHILPETSYNISYEKTDDAGTSSERMDEARDAGSYKVWVTGGTGYTINEKAADQKFVITPKPLDDTIAVTFQPENIVYDTDSHQPKITVKDLMIGAELVENVDYTAEYLGDWKDSGKHILRLTGAGENGKGNYKGTLDVNYEITKADLSQASVTVNGSYTYEAAEQRPSKDQVEVKLDGRIVDPDEYELSYQDNISAGTDAKVIVTAKADGNYMNQAEGSFTIKPAVLKISGAVLKKKVYDGQKNGEVESLIFEGLKGSDRLLPEGQDYEATAEFTDVNAGNGKTVQIAGMLKSTENTKNYILEGDTFLLEGQTIEKAPAPELEIQQISMPYDTKGEQRIELAILPEDCGTVYDAKAAIIPKHVDVRIVKSVRMDVTTVLLSLEDNSRRMIGETAVIAVDGIRTANYEDMSGKIELVLTDRAYQESRDSDDSGSGNQSKNVSSSVKNPRGWLLDGTGWRLRFPNGTYAKGSIAGTDNSGNRLVKYHWEMVNDRWYAFDENGYLKMGLFHDAGYNGTFYVDENLGMHTGWKLINGKWYYFKAVSDGTKGIMLRSQRTPDGYYVNENGEWDGK